MIKQTVILAGGKGSRLKPFSLTNPKLLFPIHGQPFINYLLDLLKTNGIQEVIFLTGYLANKTQKYLGDGKKYGLKFKYSHLPLYNNKQEEIESGTRLRNASNLLDKHFLLMYCDNYWPMDLKKKIDHYKKMNTLGLATIYNNKYGLAEYGKENNILVSDDNYVLKYDPTRKDSQLNGVDIGFFIFNKKIIDYIPKKNSHIGRDLLPKLIARKTLSAFRTDHRYYFITNTDTVNLAKKFFKPKKVVFLERDGVINKKIKNDYVRNWSQFKFIPGAIDGMRTLGEKGYKIFIITNQRGIARGLFKTKDLNIIHKNMIKELAKNNVKIDGIYFCPHEKNQCDCRKPKPGLLFQASNDHHIDLTKAIFIGDDKTDMQAGKAAGCKTVLVNAKNSFLDLSNLMGQVSNY